MIYRVGEVHHTAQRSFETIEAATAYAMQLANLIEGRVWYVRDDDNFLRLVYRGEVFERREGT